VGRARAERLLPPLLFGVLVLVPIQSWIETIDKGTWTRGLIEWWWHEFSPSGLSDGVPVNHLWFIVYIALYSGIAVLLMTRPRVVTKIEDTLVQALSGWRIIAVPMVYLIAIRIAVFPVFPVTNVPVNDVYNHALSLVAFLFGFLLVRHEAVWRDLERYRWVGLVIGCAALPVMMLQTAHPGGGAFGGVPRNAVFAIDQWAVISAILGFGSLYLRRAESPVLRYLTDAVFTCYLAHQTILVAAVWLIRPLNLWAPVEAGTLAMVTIGGSLLIYELVRRIPLIRPIWGLKRAPIERPAVLGEPAARQSGAT
jgi:surface polysaccharide O-acyltransferase-like enzyme